MEGDVIFGSIDSLWFYSNVFLQPSSKQKSTPEEELQPETQDFQEDRETNNEIFQEPKRIEALAAKKRAGARSREFDVCMDMRFGQCGVWEQQRMQRAYEAARFVVPVRCSPMPPSGDGHAMKAHLKLWAHAVACSVR